MWYAGGMLPVYLVADLNVSTQGILSFAPRFQRVLTVVDGEALIAGTLDNPDWTNLAPRRALVDELTQVMATAYGTNRLAIVPFTSTPAQEDDPASWRALVIDVGNCPGHVAFDQEDSKAQRDERVADHLVRFAARFHEKSGVHMGVLSGVPQFKEVEAYFTKAMENDGTFFKRIGTLMCQGYRVNTDVEDVITKTLPALPASYLRKTLMDLSSWKDSDPSDKPILPPPAL